MPAVLGHDPAAAAASPLGVMQQPVLQQKLPRTDRLEVSIPYNITQLTVNTRVVLPHVATYAGDRPIFILYHNNHNTY